MNVIAVQQRSTNATRFCQAARLVTSTQFDIRPHHYLSSFYDVEPPITPLAAACYLFGEIAPGWFIRTPIHILTECDDDGSFIVSDDTFAVYGTGNTPSQARQDYIVSLVEYYELVSDHARDDPHTRSLLKRLQHYVQKVD
jgi:hypothetical protein